MTAFTHVDGTLYAESVPLPKIADDVGTPFYCYSSSALTAAYDAFAEALSGLNAHICYSVKANSNQAVLATLAARGAGADIVSEGELRRALAAGVAPKDIVFSGVGKNRDEMAAALDAGIGQFNVESVPELEALSEVATTLGRGATAALRVNPDVDAQTHDKISTGRSDDKFGIDIDDAGELYRRASGMPGLNMVGLAVHIGSQLTSLEPFRRAYDHVVSLARALRADGMTVDRLDLGGGLGIVYDAENPLDLDAYATLVREATSGLDAELYFEPGRLIAGNAGILVTRVIYDKHGPSRRFVIVDAAMNDLMRPALYEAYHQVKPVAAPGVGANLAPADIAGPICETGDVLAKARDLPPVAEGDLLALMSAGAYGAVMASEYNSRPLVAEVMVKDDRYSVIRNRTPYDIMIARDRLPEWLGSE